MTEYTKGPWEWVPTGNMPTIQQVGKFPQGYICAVESLNFVADARLISAAPDMLEALPDLSFVITWLENGCDASEAAKELRIYKARIDAAIAKAKGQ